MTIGTEMRNIPTTTRPPSAMPRRPLPEPRLPRPSLGARVLGWALLTMSVGLVSCQSMFVL
jgi:hypothetical protein